MALSFKQLDAFRAVMLAGTTTEAAKMLKVSQPAVSRLISDMEIVIGYNLFEREGRRISPTSEAKLLIEEVRRALIGLDQIRQSAIEIGKSRYSSLRLVSIPSFSSTIVTDMIEEFARQKPQTRISLEVMPSDSALEWVISQQCDLGIATAEIESPAISSRVLKIGESVCILPIGHPLCEAHTITTAMLAGESFISFQPDSAYRREIDAIFDTAGILRDLKYEARTSDAICSLVAAGMGLSIVGPYAPLHNLQDGTTRGIVVKPFVPAPKVEVSLMWPTHRTISAAAKEFMALVSQRFGSP